MNNINIAPVAPAQPVQAPAGVDTAPTANDGAVAANPFDALLAQQIAAAVVKSGKAADAITDAIAPDTDDAAAGLGVDLAALLAAVPGAAPLRTESGDTAAGAGASAGRSGAIQLRADLRPRGTTGPGDVPAGDSRFASAARAADALGVADAAATGAQVSITSKAEMAVEVKPAAPVEQPHAAPAAALDGASVAARAIAAASPAGGSTAHLSLPSPVATPDWNAELARGVVWMAHNAHNTAELKLNPPHLGPLEISLSMSKDAVPEATAQFVSPHLDVRDAIEGALPRLRDMLAESGIALGQVTVSAESFHQQHAGRDSRGTGAPGGQEGPQADDHPAPAPAVRRLAPNGMVDTFA
jgi:flagellar hook-length control protein FliK